MLLLWLTVSCLICGMILGVLHDFHRIIRVLIGCDYRLVEGEKRRKLNINGKGFPYIVRQAIVFLQDVLLFVCGSVCVILLNYRFNYGQFRVLSAVAFCLGFLLYYVTLGRVVLWSHRYTVCAMKKIIGVIFCILYKPFRLFVDFFGKNAKNIFKKIRKALAKKRKKVYNVYSQKCIRKRTVDGFLTDVLR